MQPDAENTAMQPADATNKVLKLALGLLLPQGGSQEYSGRFVFE